LLTVKQTDKQTDKHNDENITSLAELKICSVGKWPVYQSVSIVEVKHAAEIELVLWREIPSVCHRLLCCCSTGDTGGPIRAIVVGLSCEIIKHPLSILRSVQAYRCMREMSWFRHAC